MVLWYQGALRNVLRAYRSACHYGDSESDSLASEYSIGSSHVFNKVMVFALKEMDGIFRALLGMSAAGDSAAGNFNLEKRPRWKKMEPLIKSYLVPPRRIPSRMLSFNLDM